MVVYEKIYFEAHLQMTNTFDTEILLHNYILY